MPSPTYAAGDRVRVTDGPLAGYEAEVLEAPADRLRLAVEVRGMRVPIEARRWQVAAALRGPDLG
jgi:transcription antitermination factor NusG